MARIRSDILYKRKVKEVEEDQRQARRYHIALPVLNDQMVIIPIMNLFVMI